MECWLIAKAQSFFNFYNALRRKDFIFDKIDYRKNLLKIYDFLAL